MSHGATPRPSLRGARTAPRCRGGIAVGVLQAATPAHLVAGPRDGLRARARGHRGHLRRLRRADGRPKVIAVKSGVAFAFVVVAAAAVTGSPWPPVAGLAATGSRISGSTAPTWSQRALVAALLHGRRPRCRGDHRRRDRRGHAVRLTQPARLTPSQGAAHRAQNLARCVPRPRRPLSAPSPLLI
jgi:hypothetical protein